MHRIHRIVLLVALIGAAPVLAGCENFDLDKFDVFHLNEKKKLPGERKPLFPNGVPGVNQGIPPEYLQGNLQEQPGAAIADPTSPPAPAAVDEKKTAAVAPAAPAKPAAQEKPKKKAKAKPKTKVAAPTPAPAPPQPAAQQQQQEQKMPPWPGQTQPQGTAAPWPTQQNEASAPWPSAPPPGTFSR